MPTIAHLRRAALIYAAEGWPVFPCQPGGKRPATEHGFRDASTDPAFISFCWRPGGPAYNVGIATGAPGPDVLDVDCRPGEPGWQAYERLKDAGLLSGALAVARTWSGKWHVWFRGTGQPRSIRIGGQPVDFLGAGGYAVAPPSAVNEDGAAGRYAFTEVRRDAAGTFDLAAARELLTPPKPPLARAGYSHGQDITALVRFTERAPAGLRNNALYWAACRVAEQGQAGRMGELIAAAVTAGLNETEARRTAASAEKRAAADD